MSILKWALIFFVVAIIAAVLGFGGIAGAMAGVAELLFYVFLAVAVVAFLLGMSRSKSSTRI